MMIARRLVPALVAVLVVSCGESGVDWSKPENFLYREKSSKKDDGVRLEYWSLVDAPCKPVYEALTDVEHYPDFIPGVDRAQILEVDGGSKTIQIAQRVIGRQ